MKKIKKFILCVFTFLIVISCICIFVSPHLCLIKKYDIVNEAIPSEFDHFKIGFFSDLDLQNDRDIQRLQKIVNQINKERFDLILFGGDIFSSQVFDNDQVSTILKTIHSTSGKFAVMGEKDYSNSSELTNILENAGFEILSNESRPIYYQNSVIRLFGLEPNSDISSLINDSNQSSYKIALVHDPDNFSNSVASNINLQISGHTHGGYIYSPIHLFNHQNYVHGSYKEKQSTLIISNGIGMEKNKYIRLFTFPNIIKVTLQHSQKN